MVAGAVGPGCDHNNHSVEDLFFAQVPLFEIPHIEGFVQRIAHVQVAKSRYRAEIGFHQQAVYSRGQLRAPFAVEAENVSAVDGLA